MHCVLCYHDNDIYVHLRLITHIQVKDHCECRYFRVSTFSRISENWQFHEDFFSHF